MMNIIQSKMGYISDAVYDGEEGLDYILSMEWSIGNSPACKWQRKGGYDT
jgi:hypothetical protein